MINIVPGILTDNTNTLLNEIKRLGQFFPKLQIDISDGVFTDFKTVQLSETNNLPQNIKYCVHLMVTNPTNSIKDITRLQIKETIIHMEISDDLNLVFEQFKKNYITCGLAINPDTDILNKVDTIKIFDFIQLMGVVPGRQGRGFHPQILNSITNLRNSGFHKPIWIDGGLNDKTIHQITNLDVQTIVIGSYFQSGEISEKLRLLNKILKQ